MALTIKFDELRKIKDSLPSGSSAKIAEELGIAADEVRAYFSAKNADGTGFHTEPGPNGGIVLLDNTRILEVALRLAWEANH